MGLKVLILDIVLGFFNIFVKLCPINDKKIAFVSLESTTLQDDLKQIYDSLKDQDYKFSFVLTSFRKNNLWTNFTYFLNTIKQLYVINTAKLVFINDNNYVISKYKRSGVCVVQVWHASGAIKKFGNVIKRSYPIANYDYILANGKYWIQPYSQAFSVKEEQVLPIGMPRLDLVVDEAYMHQARADMLQRFPQLKDKKVVLYAPTFRGDIYKGVTKVDIDLDTVAKRLGDDVIILFKCHPLLHDASYAGSNQVINMNDEVLYHLFSVADCMVSDFSSIIFDFALMHKPVYAYVPDLENYLEERGCFVDYQELMSGHIAHDEEELIHLIKEEKNHADVIKASYVDCCDGNNLARTLDLVNTIMHA